jgi:hypothetical protein
MAPGLTPHVLAVLPVLRQRLHADLDRLGPSVRQDDTHDAARPTSILLVCFRRHDLSLPDTILNQPVSG